MNAGNASELGARGASSPHDAASTRRLVLTALAVSATLTIVLGGALYFGVARSFWWIAVASVPALVVAGFQLGWRVGEPEPLYGSVLSFLYFAIIAVILIGGTWIGSLGDPMPGLATGDSTFFFVWPLMILASGVVGTIVGGRIALRSERR